MVQIKGEKEDTIKGGARLPHDKAEDFGRND